MWGMGQCGCACGNAPGEKNLQKRRSPTNLEIGLADTRCHFSSRALCTLGFRDILASWRRPLVCLTSVSRSRRVHYTSSVCEQSDKLATEGSIWLSICRVDPARNQSSERSLPNRVARKPCW